MRGWLAGLSAWAPHTVYVKMTPVTWPAPAEPTERIPLEDNVMPAGKAGPL